MGLIPEEVTVVLVRPARQGNIGAAARAMKTMGFTRLTLVAPEAEIGTEARALAHQSGDVLDAARIVGTLREAVADHDVVIGTTARRGADRMTPIRLRRLVGEVLPKYLPARVAVVFGSEEAGLSNEELDHCQFGAEIPTGRLFHSLNLAQAVMVVCYELHESLGRDVDPEAPPPSDEPRLRRMRDLFGGLESFLTDVGYPSTSSVERAMADARRALGAAHFTDRDVKTILGFFRHVRYVLRHPEQDRPAPRTRPSVE